MYWPAANFPNNIRIKIVWTNVGNIIEVQFPHQMLFPNYGYTRKTVWICYGYRDAI